MSLDLRQNYEHNSGDKRNLRMLGSELARDQSLDKTTPIAELAQ